MDKARVLDLFRLLDKGGNGCVSRESLKNVLVKALPQSADDIEYLMGGFGCTSEQIDLEYVPFLDWLLQDHDHSSSMAELSVLPVATAKDEKVITSGENSSELRPHLALDFGTVDSLWQAMADEDVRLVRGSWLIERARNGGLLPKRQECPEDAFIPLEELQAIHEASSAKPRSSDHKRAPIISISYFWRTKEHPDPERITLRLVANAIEARMSVFNEYGIAEVGVFMDWVSLYQEPRNSEQKVSFKRSLNFINVWYAHALITTLLVTGTPDDDVKYFERGWTSFEYQLSWLIKLADMYNIWPQVVDLGFNPQGRPPPIECDAFFEGHSFGNKHFTNGSDRGLVAKKFRETCESVFGSTLELDYASLDWGDEEAQRLGQVFPMCSHLKDIYLGNNIFSSLPDSIGNLDSLENLNLSGCKALRSLPKSICELKMLRVLDLSNCTIDSLPEDICELSSLTELILFGCALLTALPDGIAKLTGLGVLNIQSCPMLMTREDDMTQLRGNGCTILCDSGSDDPAAKEEVAICSKLLDLDEAREHYRRQMEADHGRVLNPITGEELDIMEHCVNLQLDTGNNREVGDIDAYREVVTDFAEILTQGIAAWASTDGGVTWTAGTVGRVNVEVDQDVTYDFHYTVKVLENGNWIDKLFVLKDCSRQQIKTRQLLVKGDPAGGKTTFAKQLLIWIMRNEEAKWLIPVMIRTVDLVRSKELFVDGAGDMIDQYLRMNYEADGRYRLFRQAREKGRLLLILDGFDEAGALERKLAKEISDVLNHEIFVVLTSRDMASTFDGADFHRFRVVRVMQLSSMQQRQVIQKQLVAEERVALFCKQLDLNAALSQMAKNPLLLSVMLAVFQSVGLQDGGVLNRSKVYSIALNGMLAKLDLVKGSHVSDAVRKQAKDQNLRNIRNEHVVSDVALRTVLKQVAFLAHTSNGGSGIRDFHVDLVERAIKVSGTGDEFNMGHWKELEEVVKKGRLPVLTWFVDNGVDTFRFAHLTFQEFLCAEQCLQECLKDDEFIDRWRELVCPHGVGDIIERGWWQQSIQMFCDLVDNADAKTKSGKDMIVALADNFLGLDEDRSEINLPRGVNDSNILTLTSLLQNNSFLKQCALASGLSSSGVSCLQSLRLCSLQSLSLKNNCISPEGCKHIATFLESSGAPLTCLNLSDNLLCQGERRPDAPEKESDRNRKGCYTCFLEDRSGLFALLESVKNHPTLSSLDLRANFLSVEAGRLIADAVTSNDRLQSVCGIDVQALREQSLSEVSFVCQQRFVERYGGRDCELYLSSGGAELLLELLLRFPLPELTLLRLDHQALASDSAGVVELFEKLGKVVASCEKLECLSISGFWDCGASAGEALGKCIKDHPQLEKVNVGLSSIDLAALRKKGASGAEEELDMQSKNIRDCGAGILSQCLPPNVTKLSMQKCGVGSWGYRLLSQCPHVIDINGISYKEFTEECTKIDLSQTPPKSTGAVSCVLTRTALTPNLQYLDLSHSNLTSKCHIHVLTPVLGSGPSCDGGCDCTSLSGTNVYNNCAKCDVDICSTCCMSQCPMVTLAEAIDKLPHLATLKIENCAFQGGRFGPVRSANDIEGYKILGESLRKHQALSDLDITKNHFKGPGFPFLAEKIALMPALKTIKLGSEPIDFTSWLRESSIKSQASSRTASDSLTAELLLLCRTIARNMQLRYLDLSGDTKFLNPSVIAALTDSLDTTKHTADGKEVAQDRRVRVDTVVIDRFTIPFAGLQDGAVTSLDFSAEKLEICSLFAPIFVLMLSVSSALTEVDFRNLDFGTQANEVVAALKILADGSLMKYNQIDLQPDRDMKTYSLQDCPAMPHGICVMSSTTIVRGGIVLLNVSNCGLDAASLGVLLGSMLQRRTVTSLDISHQSLRGPGMQALANFLMVDTRLQTLKACNISAPPNKSEDMLTFAKAIETNLTLAKLDLRGNKLHEAILDQLIRTMEEKRKMLPFPIESKICFLLCNRKLPFSQRLPMVTQVAAHDAHHGPILKIFKFCGQIRELLHGELDEEMKASRGGEPSLSELQSAIIAHLRDVEGAEFTDDETQEFLESECYDIRSAKRMMLEFGLLQPEDVPELGHNPAEGYFGGDYDDSSDYE